MSNWKELLRKYGKWVGYPLFYLFTFVIFLRIFFPYDKVKERIVSTFNSQQRPGPGQQQLAIDEVSGWWLTGIRIKGLRLTSAPGPMAEADAKPTVLVIDEVRAKLGVLSAIVGHTDLSFHVDAFGGSIDGSFFQNPDKERDVEADFDGVDLSKVDALTDLLGLPVLGTAKGTLKLDMPEAKASKGTGTLQVDIADVAIGDGKAKLKNALDWPKMSVGPLTLTAEAKDGVLKITKLAAGGKDLELSGDGKIQMRDLAMESTADIGLKFKINDTYRGKSKLTTALFGAPGSTHGGDVDAIVPKMRAAHHPDGFYAFKLQGPLGKLEPRADVSFAGGAAPGGGGMQFPLPAHERHLRERERERGAAMGGGAEAP
ncbi:MAG TPA: type II secretion system protein GspN [Polyangiaceae bacterium]